MPATSAAACRDRRSPARPAGCTAPVAERLRAVLKHPLIAGKSVRAQEDPYDDVYVEEVAFHGGPRLVLQGLTSHSAHTVRVVLNAIFGPQAATCPVSTSARPGC